MSISDRYRQLVAEVQSLAKFMRQDENSDATERIFRIIDQGMKTLLEHDEMVGEIPRMRIERDLSPVLLSAYNLFDRARLLLDEDGCEQEAAKLWEVQQKLYRLLNDL
ncbi:MAG: hypothetical protein B6I36_05770 [Desulfobacteraceae bacterium 4572_35.1]|nr:MAG: hypothetical protein B6I36_05770 [Desulfobacteraceae bacterium 4572_35.1]